MNSTGYRTGLIFRIRAVALLAIACLLLLYLLWEYFWISRQGFIAIKWHTHLMIYVMAAFAGYNICRRWWQIKQRPMAESVCMIWLSLCFSLMCAEACLYITDTAKTAPELNGWGYRSMYETKNIPQSHHWSPDTIHVLEAPEFKYYRKTNGLGFSDTADWNRPKQVGTLRILALGDSFTEGDGAPEDSSYVNQLRILFKENNYRVEVFNAGVCGSDPIYNYKEYIDTLYSIKPDVIIQTIASGDVLVDIHARGGLERFNDISLHQSKSLPFTERIKSVSLLYRIIDAATGNLAQLLHLAGDKTEMDLLKLKQALQLYHARAGADNLKVFVVFQPYRFEIENKKYNCDVLSVANVLPPTDSLYYCDLMPFFNELTQGKTDKISELFWQQNGHHNSFGYQKMAEGIFEGLKKSGYLKAYRHSAE